MAQFEKPDDVVKYRQRALTLMSSHLVRLGAMAIGKVPFDAKEALENAAVKVGTLDSLKGAIGGVGGTCKSCHDNFRGT